MSRRRARSPSRGSPGPRMVWALVALLGIGAGLWWTGQQPRSEGRAADAGRPRPVLRPSSRAPAPVQPTPRRGIRAVRPPAAPPESTPAGRVAIIFDDAGATLEQLDPILALDRPVTIAVLPGLAASRAVAERAAAAGLEVLLHLPMEAEEVDRALGPGGVTTAMDSGKIADIVRAGLADVPGAVGVNGHMGSRATADRRVMAAVLGVVRERGLFFIDSRTTTATVALPVARELGVPALERTVFLDNENDPAYIAGQIRQLLTAARAHGVAIGIGHAQKMTAEVLADLLPEFDRGGVLLIPVSVLIRPR